MEDVYQDGKESHAMRVRIAVVIQTDEMQTNPRVETANRLRRINFCPNIYT